MYASNILRLGSRFKSWSPSHMRETRKCIHSLPVLVPVVYPLNQFGKTLHSKREILTKFRFIYQLILLAYIIAIFLTD